VVQVPYGAHAVGGDRIVLVKKPLAFLSAGSTITAGLGSAKGPDAIHSSSFQESLRPSMPERSSTTPSQVSSPSKLGQ